MKFLPAFSPSSGKGHAFDLNANPERTAFKEPHSQQSAAADLRTSQENSLGGTIQ
jgi:hypothetical protein